MRQERGRDGLEREIFRSPAEADEGVALVGAGDFGDDAVGPFVQLHGLDARTIEQRLAVEAQLKLTRGFRAEFERAAQGRLEIAFPLRGERTGRQERRRCLTSGDVEGEQALGADVGLPGRGERDLESGQVLRGEGGRDGRGEQAEEAAEKHGGGTLPIGRYSRRQASPQQKGPV